MTGVSKKLAVAASFKKLLSNDGGNMAIIAAIVTMPIVLVIGAAVDFEKATLAHTSLQTAVDAAALYAGTLSETENADLTNISKPYFIANYEANQGVGTPTFAIVNNGDSVTATANTAVSNPFMAIVGMGTTEISAKAKVKKAGINLEVSLVLDNTGSMNSNNAQTGNTAIADLKTSAKKFVDIVMPPTQGQYYTKIAVVPYNNGVNLGNLAATARGSVSSGTSTTPGSQNYTFATNYYDYNGYRTRTMGITNCVTERTGTAAYTDAAVSSNPVGRSYLPSGNPCTVQEVMPLTTNATSLKSRIDAMTAGNSTAGQVGIAWGWYTLSPTIGMWSGSSTPAGYDKLTTNELTQKVKKVMILMTDGEYNSANYNGVIAGIDNTYGSFGNPYYGSVAGSGDPLDHIGHVASNGNPYTQAASLCSGIKASGVEVFVITFQLNTSYPQRVSLANNCATDASHILNADSTSLDVAFSKIAEQIQAMRISE